MKLIASAVRRQLVRGLAFAGVAAVGYAFGVSGDRVEAQPAPPAALPGTPALPPGPGVQPKVGQPAPLPAQPEDKRITAYIYGNVPITREELGEFLIARGGHEKLELLVNKKIIEVEAARRQVTVTPLEIRAALDEDTRGLGINKEDFVKHVLPRYGKTLFEWTEDVIRPRLLLTKMCQNQVKVTDEEVQKLFENRHGERREAKIICWNKADLHAAQKQWNEARKGDAEFDAVARMQADPNLAAASGRVKPIGKHPESEEDIVVKMLWTLKLGEMSGILEVPTGLICVKYVTEVRADPNAKLDDAMKKALHQELYAKKLEMAIPKCFAELKTLAKPVLYLKGPPSAAEFREGVAHITNQVGVPPEATRPVVPAGGVPAPMKP